MLEIKNRDLSAHLALANNRIDFSKQDIHAMWKEVIFYREKHHILQRQHQEVLRSHSTCANGPPEQPFIHLVQDLEKMQDMYRHVLAQNTTLKFEVQRLMQQCVNAGLIPPPQNYIVTPIPAVQPGAARRVSGPGVGHPQQQQQQQQQPQVQYGQVCSPRPPLPPSLFLTSKRQLNRDRFHGSSLRHHRIHMQRILLSQAIRRLSRGQTRHTITIGLSFPNNQQHSLCYPLNHKDILPFSNDRPQPLGLDKSSTLRIPMVNVPLSVSERTATPTCTHEILLDR
jgi:hypothetical protein